MKFGRLVSISFVFALWIASAFAQTGGVLSGGAGPGSYIFNVSDFSGGNHPFRNFVKVMVQNPAPTFAWPAILNNDGYPQSTPSALVSHQITIPSTTSVYSGNWVIKWTGTAGASGRSGMRLTPGSGSLTLVSDPGSCVQANNAAGMFFTGTDCRVVFTPPAAQTSFNFDWINTGTISGVLTGNLGPMTGLTIVRADQEAGLDAGDPWNPDYITMLGPNDGTPLVPPLQAKGLNPGVLRFLAWANINSSNRASYNYEVPNFISYRVDQYPTSAWAGTASFSADAYTIAAPSGWAGLVDGATVQFFTTSANTTTTPVANVGGTGNIVIQSSSLNQQFISVISAGSIAANSNNTLVYSAKMNVWTLRQKGLSPTTPYSMQIALCNKLKKPCWLQLPHRIDNASVCSMAAAWSTQLNAPLKLFLEFDNEEGTTGFAFEQTSYGQTVGANGYGFPNPAFPIGLHNYYALKTRTLFPIFTGCWTGGSNRIVRVGAALIFQPVSNVASIRFGGGNQTYSAAGLYTTGVTSASITGSIAVNADGTYGAKFGTLTVSSTISGSVQLGQTITCSGCAANTQIVAFRSGATWVVSNPTVVSSTAMSLASGAIVTNYTTAPDRPIDYYDTTSIAMYWVGPNVPQVNSTGDGNYIVLQTSKPVTAITNFNPGRVTCTGSAYSNGDRVALPSVGGMTQLAGAYTTVLAVSGDSFDLSNTVDSNGSAISSDTTSYGAWTSGGSCQRVVPGLNDALLNAAANYANGSPALIASALSWYENDIRSGTRLDSNGTPQLGNGTLLYFQAGTGGISSFKAWQDSITVPFNKPFDAYEGGYSGIAITTPTGSKLGLTGAQITQINNFRVGFKNSDNFRQVTNDIALLTLTFTHFRSPSWLSEVGLVNGVPSEWALFSGDLYSAPYKSFTGVANFNSGLAP